MEPRRRRQQSLHEFMAANRARMLDIVAEKLREKEPDWPEERLLAGIPEVFDQIVSALRRHGGIDDEKPNAEEAGIGVGERHQRDSDDAGMVAFSIGAISDAMGELGKREGMSFQASEYQIFNQCIDLSTASAIEEYVGRERAERHLEHSKRVGFLAHEIRNALAGARIAYANLKKGVFGINSKTGEVLGRSLTAMEALVNQTLAAVRLEVRAPIQRQPLKLRELLRQIEASLVRDRGIRIDWKVPDDLIVDADQSLLTSAATNVLQNAFKFTRSNSLVTVRAEARNGIVSIEVEDECGGLPAGKEEEILEPFVRHGEEPGGMGLGLPISREALEVQGGRLRVKDLPGKGCVFTLELPSGG